MDESELAERASARCVIKAASAVLIPAEVLKARRGGRFLPDAVA